MITGSLELTQCNALADTDQNTPKDEDANLVFWSECLDERRNNCNEASDSHCPSSTKTISLLR